MTRFTALFAGMANGVRAARLRAELDRLSDLRLADIGLARADLRRKAVEWAARR
jgi:uncharacterized protein YjiS (DUF1127 family)